MCAVTLWWRKDTCVVFAHSEQWAHRDSQYVSCIFLFSLSDCLLLVFAFCTTTWITSSRQSATALHFPIAPGRVQSFIKTALSLDKQHLTPPSLRGINDWFNYFTQFCLRYHHWCEAISTNRGWVRQSFKSVRMQNHTYQNQASFQPQPHPHGDHTHPHHPHANTHPHANNAQPHSHTHMTNNMTQQHAATGQANHRQPIMAPYQIPTYHNAGYNYITYPQCKSLANNWLKESY